MAEVIQAARRIKPAALVQVEPGHGASGHDVPADIENRYLAERVVDVAFDDIARIVIDGGLVSDCIYYGPSEKICNMLGLTCSEGIVFFRGHVPRTVLDLRYSCSGSRSCQRGNACWPSRQRLPC